MIILECYHNSRSLRVCRFEKKKKHEIIVRLQLTGGCFDDTVGLAIFSPSLIWECKGRETVHMQRCFTINKAGDYLN